MFILVRDKHLSLASVGKSPVFIDSDCDLQICARRLLLGKSANAGQTCVAPDYVLVPREFQDKLVQALSDEYVKFSHRLSYFATAKCYIRYEKFFPTSKPPSEPGNFSRLVTNDAFNRVSGLLKKTKGTVVLGGEMDASSKYIAPTVVKDVKWDDSLMSE